MAEARGALALLIGATRFVETPAVVWRTLRVPVGTQANSTVGAVTMGLYG